MSYDTKENRELQVHASLKSLNQANEDLDVVARNLIARLAPIERPSPPTGDGSNGDSPQPLRCGLADALEQQAERVRAVSRLLGTMLDRLEI